MEMFQKTGSFKVRGAFNQIFNKRKNELSKGVVTISGGNFAQATAYASNMMYIDAIICMAEDTPQNYIHATRGYCATIDLSPNIRNAIIKFNDLAKRGRVKPHPHDNPNHMAVVGTIH